MDYEQSMTNYNNWIKWEEKETLKITINIVYNAVAISGSICMNVTDMLMIVMTSHIIAVDTMNCRSSFL